MTRKAKRRGKNKTGANISLKDIQRYLSVKRKIVRSTPCRFKMLKTEKNPAFMVLYSGNLMQESGIAELSIQT